MGGKFGTKKGGLNNEGDGQVCVEQMERSSGRLQYDQRGVKEEPKVGMNGGMQVGMVLRDGKEVEHTILQTRDVMEDTGTRVAKEWCWVVEHHCDVHGSGVLE